LVSVIYHEVSFYIYLLCISFGEDHAVKMKKLVLGIGWVGVGTGRWEARGQALELEYTYVHK
jgi:hypothetical protein